MIFSDQDCLCLVPSSLVPQPVCRAPERSSFVSDLVTGYDNPNQAMTHTTIGIFNYIQSIHVVMGEPAPPPLPLIPECRCCGPQ